MNELCKIEIQKYICNEIFINSNEFLKNHYKKIQSLLKITFFFNRYNFFYFCCKKIIIVMLKK